MPRRYAFRRRRGVPLAGFALPSGGFLAQASRGLGFAPNDLGLVFGVNVDFRLAVVPSPRGPAASPNAGAAPRARIFCRDVPVAPPN